VIAVEKPNFLPQKTKFNIIDYTKPKKLQYQIRVLEALKTLDFTIEIIDMAQNIGPSQRFKENLTQEVVDNFSKRHFYHSQFFDKV
jgi:hypothetical protein